MFVYHVSGDRFSSTGQHVRCVDAEVAYTSDPDDNVVHLTVKTEAGGNVITLTLNKAELKSAVEHL